MKSFGGVQFQWQFRTYQKAVLDRTTTHLRDGHIHIVAAPGSGKTILGLELVRKLGNPALILSPSVTIRQQWGERFGESFLPKGSAVEDYVSFDLHKPELLTCITYQALHAAMQKITLKAEENEDALDTESAQDYTNFDLMEMLRKTGIKTICLDEAHHLRREWQKALESFMQSLGKDVKVIALTATPPYDSTPAEWESYRRVCGDIDEEIFVPQLVAQKTLCPHQDYLYFNAPTAEEAAVLRAHKANANAACNALLNSDALKEAVAVATEAAVLEHPAEFGALFLLAKAAKIPVSQALQNLTQEVCGSVPQNAQVACSFILGHDDLFSPTIIEIVTAILSENAVLEKKKVCILSTDKIDRMLLSSAGKLQSMQDIVRMESDALGAKMRMLILTDYIRKELLPVIGTDSALTTMGAVTAFESVRRAVGEKVPIALLSGTLVVLPDSTLPKILQLVEQSGITHSEKALSNAPYSEVVFSGSNKNKVAVLTEAFRQGLVQVLIGTASLLGEGWDAPSVNALILASAVGSFMLTNQMRGRAIRTNKNDPEKASNIWHLVTAEQDDAGHLCGADFDTMVRRFDGFLAPAYDSAWIESGTDRLNLPDNAFDPEAVNAHMLCVAKDREGMKKRWQDALGNDPAPQVLEVCEIPKSAYASSFAGKAKMKFILFALLTVLSFVLFFVGKKFFIAPALILSVVTLVFFFKWNGIRTPEKFFAKVGGCLLNALKETREVSGGTLRTEPIPARNTVFCALENVPQHDKKVFSDALGELLSPLEEPRYVLIPGKGSDFKESLACPAVLGVKKETAEMLCKHLKAVLGDCACVYTKKDGHNALLQCRKNSYRKEKAKHKKIVRIKE